ncbi:transposase [Butyrivibrio sp. AE2015]|uniref:transposase n=1 Tax=Butyrivibrio sp. AE2015 TaxID=1280663 RepID=UPI000406FB3E|nr:transposase [Butyrivibrio sp. AE2015]
MARKKRVWYPGATYHVMSRGNRRYNIFREKSDYLMFLECMNMVKTQYDFKIHSMCLMTNHFHMAIETGNTEIWKIMHKLLLSYSASYNMKYKLTGHLFENRYVGQLIEDEVYFLEVSRYIHLNPVKARMVREPLDYTYSSYGAFVEDNMSDTGQRNGLNPSGMIKGIVDTSRVLSCFHNNSKEQYRLFVEGKISHAEQEMLIQKDMKEDDMWLPW